MYIKRQFIKGHSVPDRAWESSSLYQQNIFVGLVNPTYEPTVYKSAFCGIKLLCVY